MHILHFYISVYFETLQTKTTIDPDKISSEVSRNTISKLLGSLERNSKYNTYSITQAYILIFLEVYSHQVPFLKLRKSPGFALVMLKSESHLDISAWDIIRPSWPIFALMIALSLAVGIIVWALVSTKIKGYDYGMVFRAG